MVGDKDLDLFGITACGVLCAGVTWGGRGDRVELEGAGTVLVVGFEALSTFEPNTGDVGHCRPWSHRVFGVSDDKALFLGSY